MGRWAAWLVGGIAAATPAIAIAIEIPAAPLQFPSRDDAVVEQLPTHVGDPAQRRAARAAERAQREALQQHPNELGLALQAAHDALERGRLRGDPRELGVAQAAVEPWWNLPDPPPGVRLVRATIHQSQHDFQSALVDLDKLLDATPGLPLPLRAQGELTRSGVLQVLGRFEPAQAGCRRLAGPDFEMLGSSVRLNALACLAELSSLQGQADTAAVTLSRLAGAVDPGSANSVGGEPAPGWLNLIRAELAQRRGDPAAGTLFAAALKVNPDVYTLCAYADWLLDQKRPADVVALLKGHEAADPVLLRLALAYRALHGAKSPLTIEATTTLGQRFDAALLRGDKSHGREQSRYELGLRGDRNAALVLAKTNWQIQHEPADALVLVQAAHAAGRADAAAPVWQFLRETGGRDVRLAAGGPAAAEFLPVAFASVAATPASGPGRLAAFLAAHPGPAIPPGALPPNTAGASASASGAQP